MNSGTDATGKDLVIVGGGSGAFFAVESLREVGISMGAHSKFIEFLFLKHGYKHPITVISKETYTPIDRSVTNLALQLIVCLSSSILQDNAEQDPHERCLQT